MSIPLLDTLGMHWLVSVKSENNPENCYTDGHVTWVPCHHGMARPQVADGGKASRYGG
jgi:hypothetical protein